MATWINNCRFIILKKVLQISVIRKTLYNINAAQFKNVDMGFYTGLCRPLSLATHDLSNDFQRKEHRSYSTSGIQKFSTTAQVLTSKRKPIVVSEKVNTDAPAKHATVQVFDTSDKLIGKMTFAKAEELAKKDDLKLVDIGKNEDNVHCFKLMTGKQLFEETMKQKSSKKQEGGKKEKEFRIKINISDHDLEVKLNQMKGILKKGINAKVVIRNDSKTSEAEVNKLQSSLLKKITENIQDLATVKKASKTTSDLIFILKANEEQES